MSGLLILHVQYWLHVQLIYYMHKAPLTSITLAGSRSCTSRTDKLCRMRFSDGTQTRHVTGSLWGPGNRTLIRTQHHCYVLSYHRLPEPKPTVSTDKNTARTRVLLQKLTATQLWPVTARTCPLVSMISRITQTASSNRRGWRAAD